MRYLLGLLTVSFLAATLGCGNGSGVNTAPLSDEQKQKIAEEDKRVADEESSNSSVKVTKKK